MEKNNFKNGMNSVVNDATSVELKNELNMKYKKVRAIIDGKETEIIPAYTDFSMEHLNKQKMNLLEQADSNKLLDCMYHFAKPEIFRTEGYTLRDGEGLIIDKETENVYVYCDTADSYWRVEKDEILKNVQVHDFNTVQEYAQAIGNSMILSRGLNNIEKVGVAALATGNTAYMEVFKFARKHNVPMNTAQLYLDMKMKPAETAIMTLGITPEKEPVLGRSVEDAESLLEQAEFTFGNNAKKRYVIRSINSILHKGEYTLENVKDAMILIPANELAMVQLMDCAEKENCIASVLTKWIEVARKEITEQKAA